MRKIKDVLRLRHEAGLGQRQIARSCAIAQATVAKYLKRAEAAGIAWPLPQDWDEARLQRAVFGAGSAAGQVKKPTGAGHGCGARAATAASRFDAAVYLGRVPASHPNGYSYSYFCERYERWRRQQDIVLRQEQPRQRRR